jgi:low affinity Fe/Cu permease
MWCGRLPHRPESEDAVPSQVNPILMPTDVSSRVGFFDRFAGRAADLASRAPFFAFCLLLVISWLVQGLVSIIAQGSLHAFMSSQYQLEINTTTTIITFLLVALLQNSQTRNDQATQHKLNALAEGLADLMMALAAQYPETQLEHDVSELKAAVGLEDREGTSRNRMTAGDAS